MTQKSETPRCERGASIQPIERSDELNCESVGDPCIELLRCKITQAGIHRPEGVMTEVWRPCMPNYEASDSGKVRRTTQGRRTAPGLVLRPAITKAGYLTVSPVVGGKNVTRYVHDLVAAAFLGPRPSGLVVNHIDGVKTNNSSVNLEYVTRKRNAEHAAKTGLIRVGAEHYAHKLTPDLVAAIRAARAEGVSYSRLAKTHHISTATAWKAVNEGAEEERATTTLFDFEELEAA